MFMYVCVRVTMVQLYCQDTINAHEAAAAKRISSMTMRILLLSLQWRCAIVVAIDCVFIVCKRAKCVYVHIYVCICVLAYWFIGYMIAGGVVVGIGGIGGGWNEDITMSELWPCLNACKNRHWR